MFRESIGHSGCQRIGGVAPQIFTMVLAVDVLGKIERLHRHSFRAVGQPHQDVRHCQADVAGIFGLSKRAPFRVLNGVEGFGHIARQPEISVTIQVQ